MRTSAFYTLPQCEDFQGARKATLGKATLVLPLGRSHLSASKLSCGKPLETISSNILIKKKKNLAQESRPQARWMDLKRKVLAFREELAVREKEMASQSCSWVSTIRKSISGTGKQHKSFKRDESSPFESRMDENVKNEEKKKTHGRRVRRKSRWSAKEHFQRGG